MNHFQGITAKIISNGQVLNFYDDPDAAEGQDSRACHYYVEAVAGSTFQVKVDLTPQFSFYKMKAGHAVKVTVTIAGRYGSLEAIFTTKYLQQAFSRAKSCTYTFTGPKHFCKETRQWMWSDYSFGNLVLKETPDPGFSVKQAQNLGRIQVTVKRVEIVKRLTAFVPDMTPFAMINEVPEKALKGRPIDTTVRLANARPISGPDLDIPKAKNIDGEVGEPVVFNIYYRSRRALQILGCIPRSPSPVVEISDDEAKEPVVKPESNSFMTDSSSDPSNTFAMRSAGSPDELRRQIQVLNARITDLEHGKVKAEAANTGTVIKDEESSPKRKRREDRNGPPSQRRRRPAEIEHVDLTDD